jgi:hypothetical protein
MGIETLNSAARAAGFAMAPADDLLEDVASPPRAVETPWRPGEAVLARETPAERFDWMRALLSLFGRRAPVSPA